MGKKSVLVFIISLLPALLFAQAIDKPAATVRLTKAETITVRQLQKTITPYELQLNRTTTQEERKNILNGLVNRKLIEQAAERDKIVVSDAELNTEMKKYLGVQSGAGRDLTDSELQVVVKSSSSNAMWSDYVAGIKYQLVLTKYVQFKNPNLASTIQQPTDSEIKAYYEANKITTYVWPDTIKIKWILIDTRNLTAKEDRDKAAKRADDIYKELKAGGKFDDLVARYSDDVASKYKGGDIGYVQRNDTQKQTLGESFVNAIFALKKGETSGILTTNIGLAIVQVTDRIDAKILAYDDKIPPDYTRSVVDDAKTRIIQSRLNDAGMKAIADLVNALRKEGEIKIFEENLTW